MRPTLPALGKKARKFPMSPKHGNKHFYKGTGTLPGLPPKRQGRHGFSKNPGAYILMPERMNRFVPPQDPDWEQSRLRPYVSKIVPVSSELARREDAYPEWPYAFRKEISRYGGVEEGKSKSVRGFISKLDMKGYDAAYHLQLVQNHRKKYGEEGQSLEGLLNEHDLLVEEGEKGGNSSEKGNEERRMEGSGFIPPGLEGEGVRKEGTTTSAP
ncbi:hypothetical protein BT69DRAFT_1334621 [Atractiella rhizophila]|nr:hypothetical protein BT69DRAFT_1334621 [Atractiella rhizophila]